LEDDESMLIKKKRPVKLMLPSTPSILTIPSQIGERRPLLPSFLKRGWGRLQLIYLS